MPGVTLPMELKDGNKPPSARKHTDVQARFIASWPAPVVTVTDIEGALRAIRVMRSGFGHPREVASVAVEVLG